MHPTYNICDTHYSLKVFDILSREDKSIIHIKYANAKRDEPFALIIKAVAITVYTHNK